ncbi:MAG: MFS transporter [Ekhidna sp.]|nr:MFS transporter [Ekhidna sp.]
MSAPARHILPTIVLAQFFCTSLWFAGNAVMPDLADKLNLLPSDVGIMTSSVQFGFILGTLFYAIFTIADRFNPSTVFFISAFLGALSNVCLVLDISFYGVLSFRFLTGFFLAGIYPVGMKIAADYYEKGLGKALSFLVGALVLGTAFPHLVASFDAGVSWEMVVWITSGLAVIGGLLIKLFVGEGPYRKIGLKPNFSEIGSVFKDRSFRSAAFGYFGHMWELYAFWAFVPFLLLQNDASREELNLLSSQSFMVIAVGTIACFIGGYISERYGAQRTARTFLVLSGVCCLLSPFAMQLTPTIFLVFLLFWGMVVIADSPLFSSLVAQRANPSLKGTALTLVNNIGFTITIFSIQLLSYLSIRMDGRYIFLCLALGPLFGVLSLVRQYVK